MRGGGYIGVKSDTEEELVTTRLSEERRLIGRSRGGMPIPAMARPEGRGLLRAGLPLLFSAMEDLRVVFTLTGDSVRDECW